MKNFSSPVTSSSAYLFISLTSNTCTCCHSALTQNVCRLLSIVFRIFFYVRR